MAWSEVVEKEDVYVSCDAMSITEQEHDEVMPGETEDAPRDDPDTDDELPLPHEPKTTTEKRRAQNDIMKAFAADISVKSSRQDIENAVKKSAKQEHMSVRDIMANHATTTQITNPRDYQTELFQRAKDENTIAVLDTGTGKTHIATLLLRHVLDDELEYRSKGGAHRIAFFLVDSVNLVFQQANVLRCGLDQSVEGICGSMGSSLWNKETWDKHFAKHMVIVCTAQVLIECMMHSFVTMARINLLVFDEAHHAKGNHPYARIMKDYYVRELDNSKRPRIFGMTASPVDVRGQTVYHLQDMARELERLLHAKIATATESMLASNNITKPDEEVVFYSPLRNKFETALQKELKTRYGHIDSFQKFFDNAQMHAVELGRWASDMYWTFAFAEEQARKLQIREEFRFNKTLQRGQVNVINAKLKILEEAATFIQGFDSRSPSLSLDDVSSKVLELHKWLSLYYERSDEALCLVFVQKRQTARLLKTLFEHIGGPNLRCDVLVGVNVLPGECNVTLRSQILTLQKFRRRELNCLFATSVAEEGLDIQQCNLVIRFDLYRTMIEYIQSRGRARHHNSKYLHMLEQDNYEHIGRAVEVRQDEETMRKFCSNLARDRNLVDVDDDTDILDLEDGLYPSYTDSESGAKLTYRSSLAVLNHFVAVWPAPNHENMWQPTYTISAATNTNLLGINRGGFICEVILPEHLPLISMVGDVQSRKIFAKCSAAFKMCLELRKKGFLSPNLLPTMQKHLPAQRNALLAVSEKRKGRYPMLIKPNFWSRERGAVPHRLYLTIVNAEPGLERDHQSLGLLTRVPFPQLPSFPIYHTSGRTSNISSRALDVPFLVDLHLLEVITKFTLQVFINIYNKEFENDPTKMSYWIVPVQQKAANDLSRSELAFLLDMEQVHKVVQNPTETWNAQMCAQDLVGRYLIDPYHGGHRYFSERITDLRPQDPVPAYVARQGHRFMNTILDYTDSKWSRTRDTSRWNPDQPVFEVEKVPFRRNHLACVEEKEMKELERLKAFVCPEPLRISNFATKFVTMCYVLPAIIHRFESYLIALDACKILDLNINPALALEALTKDSENSGEHDEDKINFRSGMGPNYERLEFLGDCFLKMATSISVFVQQPDENEFEFHVRRMVMLCNQNLMETAIGTKKVVCVDGSEVDLELCKYIRTESFSRRTWYPEGLKLLKGKGSDKSDTDWLKLTHNLGDKSIADVCEAFIGAAFMQYHKPGSWEASNWDEAVKAVKLFANSPDHSMSKWSDYYDAYIKPKYQVADATASVHDLAQKVEAKHPYHFKYPRVLRSAFVHPSQPFMWEQIPNYQRLEFLGDSLLDVAFILHLFYKYPDKDPHWLTEHKTPMVSNKFLGAVCVKLGWHTHIKQNNSLLSTQIRNYVYEVEDAERESHGAVDYWVGVSEPPKCLADVIEAYVAAMFVDSEFDFNVVQNFFDMHLKPFFVDMTLDAYESFSSGHPTTRLSRLLTTNFGCREWRMGALPTDTIIPGKGEALAAMFMIHNKVRFHDLGTSGRYARERCSKKALQALEGLPPYEYRKKYDCDCVDEDEMVGVVDEVADMETEELIKAAMGLNI